MRRAAILAIVDLTPLWFDLSTLPDEDRALLVLEGKDAPRFVQGLISADLETLKEGLALPASLLTVKAKLLSDAVVWKEAPQRFVLAVPQARATAMQAHVDRHIIMDEVTLSVDSNRRLALQTGAADPLPADRPELLVRSCSYPLAGHLWVGSPEALKAQGEAHRSGSAQDFDWARVQSGVPAWGRELSEQRLPPEAGFTPSVSYSKGCFMGQEPLARIHARGQVNRVLVRVQHPGGEWEIPNGQELPLSLDDPGSNKGGEICTWAPAQGQGLAIVHRSLAKPGTVLESAWGEIQVQSTAIGDDPGVKARS